MKTLLLARHAIVLLGVHVTCVAAQAAGRVDSVRVVFVAPAFADHPAAVIDRFARAAHTTPDSIPTLLHDIQRGAEYGAIAGAVIGIVGAVAYISTNSGPVCCEQPQHHVSAWQVVGISIGSTAAGGIVGGFLGYNYHFNRQPAK